MVDIGDVVIYTSNFYHVEGEMTKRLMKKYLIPGDEYKILDIYNDSYLITSFGSNPFWSFWVPHTSFVSVDSRRFMQIKYELI